LNDEIEKVRGQKKNKNYCDPKNPKPQGRKEF